MVCFMHCLSVMHWYYCHAVMLWSTVYNILCIKFTDIREELGKQYCRENFDEKARKRHFITRQDCRNACRNIKDFKNHWHEDDAISVDRIVKELWLEDPSSVIAYKPRLNNWRNLAFCWFNDWISGYNVQKVSWTGLCWFNS